MYINNEALLLKQWGANEIAYFRSKSKQTNTIENNQIFAFSSNIAEVAITTRCDVRVRLQHGYVTLVVCVSTSFLCLLGIYSLLVCSDGVKICDLSRVLILIDCTYIL